MSDKTVVVAAHGHCFDGVSSAALFTALRRALGGGALDFRYRSCGYAPTMRVVPESWLVGDENAIVDFRYSPSKRLSWYFDHHATAFGSDEEREAALQDSERRFFDPSYGSCTKLVADVATARFGVDLASFAALVSWADRIDSARFASAAAAVDRSEPVLQLASVVEQHGEGELYRQLVPLLLRDPLDQIARSDYIQQRWTPIAQARRGCYELFRERSRRQGEVILVEAADAPLGTSGKFFTYALFPDSLYSVTLTRMKQHLKISVGYNPWAPRPRGHDIAALCRRYGGGGHAMVGALTLPWGEIDRARQIAAEIVAELNH
ncbi:MAG: hypothetical protein HY744_08350 [Deltaproteobacteria bacterium]|nr:hypothetical protein [Deltaproteobacteria bacterium]